MHRDKLPDILRPTELCDFSDIFRSGPRPARLLAATLGLAGLLAWAQLAAPDAPRPADLPVAAVAQPDRR